MVIKEVFFLKFNLFKKEARIVSVNEELLSNIRELRRQLIEIGYNKGEVDYMIFSCSKGCQLSKIDSEQLRQIEEALQNQLELAKKCKEFIEYNSRFTQSAK